MDKLLTTIFLLCITVEVDAESYMCETAELLSNTPESAAADYDYPIFLVDVPVPHESSSQSNPPAFLRRNV